MKAKVIKKASTKKAVSKPKTRTTAKKVPETLISFLLDETGSMVDVKDLTINSFNEYIKSLRKKKEMVTSKFTLTKFNSSKVEIVHNGVQLSKVSLLNDKTYLPSETTPLYDAIGKTILSIEHNLSGNNKQNVLMIIQTDGYENASREYTRDKVFELIENKKKLGWTFLFMGADIDAYGVGSMLGVSAGNTISYASGSTGSAMGTLSNVSARYVSNVTNSKTGIYNSENLLNEDEKEIK